MASGKVEVQVTYNQRSKAAALASESLPVCLQGFLEEVLWKEGVARIKQEVLEPYSLKEPNSGGAWRLLSLPCCRHRTSITEDDREVEIEYLSQEIYEVCQELTARQQPKSRWRVSKDQQIHDEPMRMFIHVDVQQTAVVTKDPPSAARESDKRSNDPSQGPRALDGALALTDEHAPSEPASSVPPNGSIATRSPKAQHSAPPSVLHSQKSSPRLSAAALADAGATQPPAHEVSVASVISSHLSRFSHKRSGRASEVSRASAGKRASEASGNHAGNGAAALTPSHIQLEENNHSEAAQSSVKGEGTDKAAALDEPLLLPRPDLVLIPDPRNEEEAVGVIGFYYPGKKEPWDEVFQAEFLGNFYDLEPHGMMMQAPQEPDVQRRFRTSEAAYQALKFWDNAAAFENATGEEAYHLKKANVGQEDWTFAGFGSNWHGMLAVLQKKFAPETRMAQALLMTDEAFLLEHNAVSGRDKVWSDDGTGEGSNWLGMQLMLVRDQLSGKTEWTEFIDKAAARGRDGRPKMGRETEWQESVRKAASALVNHLKQQGIPSTKAKSGKLQTPSSREAGSLPAATANQQEAHAVERKQLLKSLPPCFTGLVGCGPACSK